MLEAKIVQNGASTCLKISHPFQEALGDLLELIFGAFWPDFGGPNRASTFLYASRDFSYNLKSVVVASRSKKQQHQDAQKQLKKQSPPAPAAFLPLQKANKQGQKQIQTDAQNA